MIVLNKDGVYSFLFFEKASAYKFAAVGQRPDSGAYGFEDGLANGLRNKCEGEKNISLK
jgi:hypothetical protein